MRQGRWVVSLFPMGSLIKCMGGYCEPGYEGEARQVVCMQTKIRHNHKQGMVVHFLRDYLKRGTLLFYQTKLTKHSW